MLYLICLVSFSFSLLYASISDSFLFKTCSYQPALAFNLKRGNQHTVGQAGATMPVQVSNDKLWLMQIWGLWDSEVAREWNIGVGYRQPLGTWAIGTYGFFDRQLSIQRNYHAQLTLGTELLGENLESRINGYIPISTGKVVGPVINKTNQAPLVLIHKLEKALSGIDIEIGGNLPSFKGLQGLLTFYYFKGRYVKAIHGSQLRAQLNLTPYLVLTGQASYDRLRKNRWLVGLQFKFSLSAPEEKIGLKKKMAQMIVRDINVMIDSYIKSQRTNYLFSDKSLRRLDKSKQYAVLKPLVKDDCKFIEVKEFTASPVIRNKVQSIIIYPPMHIHVKLKSLDDQKRIMPYGVVKPYHIEGVPPCKHLKDLSNFIAHSYWRIYPIGQDYGIKAYTKGLGGGKDQKVKKIDLNNQINKSNQVQVNSPYVSYNNGLQTKKALTIGDEALYVAQQTVTGTSMKQLQEEQERRITARASSSASNRFKFLGIKPRMNLQFMVRRDENGKDILERLKAELQHSTEKFAMQVLAGMPNIGKTELATEYIRQTKLAYDGVFWVQANMWPICYSFYAESLAIDLKTIKSEWLAYTIHENLMYRRYKKVLWIYDDVHSVQVFHNELFSSELKNIWCKSNTQVHILITSRALYWGQIVPIRLGLFNEFDTRTYLNFFFKNTTFSLSKYSMKKVLRFNFLLGGVPLAIAQATDYIKNKRQVMGIEDYINIYRTHYHCQPWLPYSTEDLNNNDKILWTIWEITRKDLSKEADLLLCISCFLSSNNISNLLFSPLWGNRANDLIKELANYSLVQLNSDFASFNIHKSLQKILKLQQYHKPLIVKQVVDLAMLAYRVFKEEDPNTWIGVKYWLPHIASLLEQMEEGILKENIFFSYSNLVNIFKTHSGSENYLSRHLNQQAAAHQFDGAIKNGLNYLSRLNSSMGCNDLVKNYLLQHLAVQINAYGTDHIEMAGVLYQLGVVEATLGYEEIAEGHLLQALALQTQYYGEGHMDVILTLISLASLELKLDRLESSRDYLLRALALQNLFYRENIKEQMIIVKTLGVIELELGHDHKARDYLMQALALQTCYYEGNHMAIILTLLDIIYLDLKLGHDQAAKAHLLQVLALQTCYYEGVSLILTSIWVNLSHIELKYGFYEKARSYLEQTLGMQKRIYEEDHIDMANVLVNLANVEVALGCREKARSYLLRALTLQKTYCGSGHIAIANLLNNLGNIESSLGHNDMAKKYLEQALVRQINYYGCMHIEIANLLNNLGTTNANLGEYKIAKDYYNQALMLQTYHYGEEHIELANTLINLGAAEADLGYYETAKYYLLRALAIQANNCQQNHITQIIILSNLARVEKKLGYDEHSNYYLQQVSALQRYYSGLLK